MAIDDEVCIGEEVDGGRSLRAESMLEVELTGEEGLSSPMLDLSGHEVLMVNALLLW